MCLLYCTIRFKYLYGNVLLLARVSALFDVPAETDGEPEDDLAEGNDAESQTEAKESSKVRNEVKDCHPLGDLVLCRNKRKNQINFELLTDL